MLLFVLCVPELSLIALKIRYLIKLKLGSFLYFMHLFHDSIGIELNLGRSMP